MHPRTGKTSSTMPQVLPQIWNIRGLPVTTADTMSASGYVKGQITRATNALKEKLTAAEQTMIEFYAVKDSKEDLEKDSKTVTACKRQMLDIVVGLNQWVDNLRSAWQRGENYIKELEDEKARFDILQEFMDHWEASRAEQLIANAQVLVITAESIKANLENTPPSEEKLQDKQYTKHTSGVEIQLPKLEIPEFERRHEFWELYSIAVHNHPTLGAASKFLHLKSKLKGRAGDLIASMRLSAENYPRAVELLLSTYNRPDVLRNRLVEQLEALPPAGKAVTDQRTTLCKVKAIWVQLANLNEQPGSTTTMRIIRSKFPRKTRERVGEMRRKNDNWTAEDLLDAFDKVIDQLEIMEDTDPTPTATSKLCVVDNPQSSSRQFNKSSRRRPSTQRSSSSRSDGSQRRSLSNEKRTGKKQLRCSFCLQTRHKTAYCDEVVSPYARRKIVVQSKLCWKCLRAGHQRLRCDAPPCRTCGRSHHWSLCLQGTYSPQSKPKSKKNQKPFPKIVQEQAEWKGKVSRQLLVRRKSKKRVQNKLKISESIFKRTITEKVPTSPKTEDESDRFSDEIDDEGTEASLTNAVHKRKSTRNENSETLFNPPRLHCVVKALTLNRNTKMKQILTIVLQDKSRGYKTKLHLWTRKTITTVSAHTDGNDEFDNSRRHNERTEVDVLIGMDYYWDVVDHKCNRQLPSGLVQSNTKLGPVLSGNASPASSRTHSVSDTDPTEDQQDTAEVERLVQRLFGLESMCFQR
ncbi:peptidase family A16 [Ostertagia ostertagi]